MCKVLCLIVGPKNVLTVASQTRTFLTALWVSFPEPQQSDSVNDNDVASSPLIWCTNDFMLAGKADFVIRHALRTKGDSYLTADHHVFCHLLSDCRRFSRGRGNSVEQCGCWRPIFSGGIGLTSYFPIGYRKNTKVQVTEWTFENQDCFWRFFSIFRSIFLLYAGNMVS